MKFNTTHKSINFNFRDQKSDIKFVVIHYTATHSLEEAIRLLCDPNSKASSHFLISKKGEIFQLVNEEKRAWHAGRSAWKNIIDINSYSLGIELENSGHLLEFEGYSEEQINSLMDLINYIRSKFNISKNDILGHSDIAPMRKIDPGEKFPWHILEKNNLAYLPKLENFSKNIKINESAKNSFITNLNKIGYDIGKNIFLKTDSKKKLIKAFQMHYQQDFVKGCLNEETIYLANQYCKELID